MLKRRRFVLDPLSVLFLACAVAIFGIPLLVALARSAGCRNKADIMGLEHDWGFTTGCMVKVDGRYYPLGAIRYANGKVQVEAAQ